MLCIRRKKRKAMIKEEERQGKDEGNGTQKEVLFSPLKSQRKIRNQKIISIKLLYKKNFHHSFNFNNSPPKDKNSNLK